MSFDVCVCEQPKCTGSTGGGGGLGSVGGSGESHKSSKLESRKRGVVCVCVCVQCKHLAHFEFAQLDLYI